MKKRMQGLVASVYEQDNNYLQQELIRHNMIDERGEWK